MDDLPHDAWQANCSLPSGVLRDEADRFLSSTPEKCSMIAVMPFVRHQLIQDDSSWAEAAAVALAAGDDVSSGDKEVRLEQLLQRTQR